MASVFTKPNPWHPTGKVNGHILKKGTTTYAFYLAEAGENTTCQPETGRLEPASQARITFAGNKKALRVKDGTISIPSKTITETGQQPAYLFVIN